MDNLESFPSDLLGQSMDIIQNIRKELAKNGIQMYLSLINTEDDPNAKYLEDCPAYCTQVRIPGFKDVNLALVPTRNGVQLVQYKYVEHNCISELDIISYVDIQKTSDVLKHVIRPFTSIENATTVRVVFDEHRADGKGNEIYSYTAPDEWLDLCFRYGLIQKETKEYTGRQHSYLIEY